LSAIGESLQALLEVMKQKKKSIYIYFWVKQCEATYHCDCQQRLVTGSIFEASSCVQINIMAQEGFLDSFLEKLKLKWIRLQRRHVKKKDLCYSTEDEPRRGSRLGVDWTIVRFGVGWTIQAFRLSQDDTLHLPHH
jgi:hypothetical protein